MMDQLIKQFPAQLREALETSHEIEIRKAEFPIFKVFVAGMGGSGIGGDYVSEIISDECAVPYIVKKSYDIPAWIDKNTLAIVSSYSGNTEETVSALNQLKSTGAKIVCISSGGKILDIARTNQLDIIQLPAGQPSPRACLGYSLVAQLILLNKLGLIGRQIIENIKTSADLLKFEQEEIKLKAERIAQLLLNKTVIIYSADKTEPIALRWRQQINENSKMLSWHHSIPEMNHNEIVGWKNANEQLAVVFLRNKDDNKRVITRTDFVKKLLTKYTNSIVEVYSKGQSRTEKMMYLTHLGDWISWYLAVGSGVNASEIDVINQLKDILAKSEI
ncbi:MAG: bifunctional phosphoglucose/phosphomannose isomerase [Saprospiraceae bacterium]|nr:bifunctional phosphoglucose/phosphomannose isomerase [Saprospiraceae bacterium]